jgi:excisionase family DNA binding protein
MVVSSGMTSVEVLGALDGYPLLLTIEEAAEVLRIGRSLAYGLAHQYEESDGREGLPVMRFGSLLRVPRWALAELLFTGRVVRLADGPPS